MLVEFRCGNYTRFDQATGQSSVCGQRMTADAADVGLLVTCPRCNNDVEVPVPKRSRGDAKADNNAGSKAARKDDELSLAPEMEVQREVPTTPEVVAAGVATTASPAKKRQRCPRCGNNLDQRGVCAGCRYVRPRFEKAKQSLDEMEMEPAGMMLWFAQVMSEGVPMKTLAWLAHVLIPILAIAMMVFGLLVVKGVLGGLIFLMSFAGLCLYVGMAYKGYQFLRDGNAQLAWFQKPIWNFCLHWSRLKKWQGIDQRHRDRRIVDKRGEAITDDTFAHIKGLKNAQILDLEGTLITDRSLAMLYQMKHLHCVVLKKTKVTHQGVTKLQQSVPRLWIWY